jgi:hypothetical protein
MSRTHGARFTAALAALVAFGLVGCDSKRAPAKKGELEPLAAPSWLFSLDVPGFGVAPVAVPLGARVAKPVLIALHGDADRPEWPCGSYRGVVGQRGFVLCPRGEPRPDGRFAFVSYEHASSALRAALPQLKTRFDGHVAGGEVVLAAIGPSVEYAIRLAVEEPKFFARLLLVDGSTRRLTAAAASRFADMGGKRVLVVCGRGCDDDVEDRVASVRPGGVESRLVRMSRGQGLDADAMARILEEWPWLIADDKRWR